MSASVSGSTLLVASSRINTLQPRTNARISDNTCFSPAEKFPPSVSTSTSSLNLLVMLSLAEGLECSNERASLSSASVLTPSGSMFSLHGQYPTWTPGKEMAHRTVPLNKNDSCGMMASRLRIYRVSINPCMGRNDC